MLDSISLWFEYILRFSHLVAGIAWIGSSFYFIWLDSSFLPPKTPRKNVDGEVFMVHGGFYYQVEKKKIAPGELPDILHWFRWEATITLITGYLLLIYIYFFNNASLLIDPQTSDLSAIQAIGCAVLLIGISWFVYDFIWHPKFENKKKLQTLLSVIYFSALIFICMHIFSGRGSFILIGVTFGTLMVANVWVRILPGQKRMLASAQAGQIPDYSESLKSKTRSVHNTYFIFPVLFIMISNHYPLIYNHSKNWLLLIVLGVSGALTRHSMVTNGKNKLLPLFAALGLLLLIYITAQNPQLLGANQISNVSYENIQHIVQARCLPCHSTNNTDDIFKTAQKGLVLESQEQILANKLAIKNQLLANIMPLGNKTKMTDQERALFLKWLSSN